MDELERQLLIMDLEDEAAALDQEFIESQNRNPDWWNIALGAQEATPIQYEKAKEIKRRFSQFQPLGISCIYQRFEMFEQAMLVGKG